MTPAEYWARIKQLPLTYESESGDGKSRLYRTNTGGVAHIDYPDDFTTEQREQMIEFYEGQHKPSYN